MRISCPYCYDHIEIADDADLSDISCPSCDSTFDLVPSEKVDETIVDESGMQSTSMVMRTIGRFELIQEVGSGAFGSVWRGNDPTLDRKVAVKVPRKGQLTPFESELFFREARAAAQLKHPNIVPVHEIGKENETIYIVSEFVDGHTLAERLVQQKISMRESALLCKKVALALEHAHSKGVIHRDLKPSNIMLDFNEEPFVMDFGLAKRDAGEITMTVEGRILGTPAYMSPEQAKGEGHHVDGRTDLYSLGVILFELLTGEIPFRGNQRMLLHQVINDEVTSPRKLNNSIPKDLETICLKCLQKQPSRRYESAQELADDLDSFLSGKPISARPVGTTERVWRWCQRKPAMASAITLASLLLAAVAIGGPLVALQQAQIANQNKDIAESEREYAAQQTKLAEQSQAIAKREKENADQQKQLAEQSQSIAQREKESADQQRKIAQQQTEFAKEQKKLTELANQETEKKEEALNNLKKERSRQFVNKALRASETGKPYDAMVLLDQAIESSDYDQDIQRLNVNRFRMLWQKHPISGFWNWARVACWAPNEKLMAIGDTYGGVQIWNGSGKFMIEYFKPHNSPIMGLTFDETGKSIISSASDGTFRVIDIEKSVFAGGYDLKQKFSDLWVADGVLNAFAPVSNEFMSYDLSNINQAPKVTEIKSLAYSRQRLISAVSVDGKIQFLNLDNSDSKLPDIQIDGTLTIAAFSPDGKRLAVASQEETDDTTKYNLTIFDVDTGKSVTDIPDVKSIVSKLLFTDDSKQLAFDQTGESNAARIFNLVQKTDRTLYMGQLKIAAIEFSQSGNLCAIVIGERDNPELQIHDIKSTTINSSRAEVIKSFAKLTRGPNESFLITTLGTDIHHISRWQFDLESSDRSFVFDSPVDDVFFDRTQKVYAGVNNQAYFLDTKQNASIPVEARLLRESRTRTVYQKVSQARQVQIENLQGQPQVEEYIVTITVPELRTYVVSMMFKSGVEIQPKSPPTGLNGPFTRLGKFEEIAIYGPSQVVFTNELSEQSEFDGKFIYRFWNATAGKPISEKLILDQEIESATFSEDGRFLMLFYKTELKEQPSESTNESPNEKLIDYDIQILDVEQGKMVTDVIRGNAAIVSPSAEYIAVVSDKTVKIIEINSPVTNDFKLERAISASLSSKRVDEFGELITSDYANIEIETEKARATISVPESLKKKWRIASTNWALDRANSQFEMFEVARLHAMGWRDVAADDPTPNAILGSIYGLQGNIEEALEASERAVELQTGLLYAWTNLATFKLKTGDRSGYREYCEKIWTQFGNHQDPFIIDEAVWINNLWIDDQFNGEAILNAAENNYQKFPKSRRFANTLIAVLLRTNKLKRAKAILDKLGTETPGHELATKALLATHKIDFGNKYDGAENNSNWIDALQVSIINDENLSQMP